MSTILERADPEFATLRRHREHLSEQAVRLRSELRELEAQNRTGDERSDLGNRLQAIIEEQQAMSRGPYAVAKRRAQQTAAQQIRQSANHRKQVLALASAWVSFLASCAALVATTADARREGVPIAPVPPTVAAQPAEAASWLKGQIAAGVLDADALPVELRALLEEGGR